MTRTYDEIVAFSTHVIVKKSNVWSGMKRSLNTLGIVLVVWGVCVLLGGFLFRLIEHSTTGVGWIDSYYWAVQVASTTGPGDVAPKTDMGKFLFIVYNLIVSVVLLLILGANIVVRAIEDANALTHKEQEWSFFVQEQTYAMAARSLQLNYLIAQQLNISNLPPPLEGQDPITGAMRPCPPQPHDTQV